MPPEPPTPAPLVALTGASGFLGRRLVAALQGRGFRVRALYRSGTLPDPGEATEGVRGDLGDPLALARLLDGAVAVVHAAAVMGAAGPAALARVNVEGSERLARAARGRVTTFVLVSSVAALSPGRGPYAASKAMAEARVSDLFPDACLVRPPLLLGPGSQFERMLRGLARLPAVPIPASTARLRPVAAADAAEAIAMLALGGAPGRAFDLPGEEALGLAALARLQLAALGSRARVLPTPARPWAWAGRVLAPLPRSPLSPEAVATLVSDTPGDAAAARAALDFRPRPVAQALRAG